MRKLKILGCGDAFASGGRATTSFLVKDQNDYTLIDCGASTLVRLKQEGISLSSIQNVFISHFHGDHYGGMPFLMIANKFELNGEGTINIAGPKGIKEQLQMLQEAMYPGTSELIDQLPLTFTEYDLGLQKLGNYPFQAFPVRHAPPSQPHGLRIDIGGEILAFSGDTEWDDILPSLAKDASLFITECNNLHTDSTGHLSHSTLLEKREVFNAQRIAISHMGIDMLNFKDSPFIKLEDGMELDLW